MRGLAAMRGGNRRAATISAACSGATASRGRQAAGELLRRWPRRGCRSATTATWPREASALRRGHYYFWTLLLITLAFEFTTLGQTLSLPSRSANALTGKQLATNATLLSPDLHTRESFIEKEFLSGNVPDFLRRLCQVKISDQVAGGTNIATIYVTPDYLALGSNDDYLLVPMTPATAQRVADATDCILPMRRMVDVIHASAEVKLSPQPMTPGATMTTFPVFVQHNAIIRTQRMETLDSHPLGALVAGVKKDVVITARLDSVTNKVAIYGWHRPNGVAIQPLYLGHTATWVDYSHGIRLVSQTMLLNGQQTNISAVLKDSQLASLLSDEGVILHPRYSTNHGSPGANAAPGLRWPHGFTASKQFSELNRELNLPNGVRVLINTPNADSLPTNKPVQLIFFALPNGNTIEWTIGKQTKPEDDWHFDLQHIGAQTRFLRTVLTNQTVVVAYLENSLKSWPAWRREHGNDSIPAVIDSVRKIFADYRQEIVLTGHSGGGSLTFGYLNTVPEIPRDIKRIALLDSNYAYETTNHFAKLVKWLKQSDDPITPSLSPSDGERVAARTGERSANYLSVLAYHDSIALLEGKTFVSERGGTWGRSHAMLADLQREFSFTSNTNRAGLQSHIARNGRIQLLLKENPEQKILHTVQVELNGFIHALLTGTPLENHGYEYLGPRAYEQWIQAD
jgi:pimeloyl-ACP methyl ester carboxylesterase